VIEVGTMSDLKVPVPGSELVDLFDKWTNEWHAHQTSIDSMGEDIRNQIQWIHFHNFYLWHYEDEVRRDDVPDAVLVQCKRQIDKHNQHRNNGIEAVDIWIAGYLKKDKLAGNHEINSETPGSIIDRLSILSLKIHHMHEEMLRQNVPAAHRVRAKERLEILTEQSHDLVTALDRLWDDLIHQRKAHKLYRQFKMYNDPDTNPALYNHPLKPRDPS
jgi:hypothetical protein